MRDADAVDVPPVPPEARGALHGLLTLLDLAPVPDQADVFIGPSQPQPWGRVYGGQVLGQAIVAAQRTVDAERPVHSMHGYFLRAGDANEPITFAVERLRDGHSFSARRTHALQFGRPILSMIASFQSPGTGLEHQSAMPGGIPDPESLPTLRERYADSASNENADRWLRQRPMDLRHVEPPVFLESADATSTRQHVWMRAVAPMPDDPALHAAVLAYASDYSMLEPVLRGHGRSFSEPGIRIASLDHALWWHRPARVDDWLLYELESPSAQGARGLGTARIYTRAGVLVASVAQEGMVRLPRPDPVADPGSAPPVIVDLTHPLATGMPTYPGDPAVSILPVQTVDADGSTVRSLHLGSHTGTHVDAPSHVEDALPDLDQLPLECFVGPAVVVDARGRSPREALGPEIFDVVARRLRPGAVVLVATGWDVFWDNGFDGTAAAAATDYAAHPWLTPDAARRLVAAGVRTVGIDALSVDRTPPFDHASATGPAASTPEGPPLPTHHVLAAAHCVIAENLRGVSDLLAHQAAGHAIEISLLPLRIDRGDGAPVRAVATVATVAAVAAAGSAVGPTGPTGPTGPDPIRHTDQIGRSAPVGPIDASKVPRFLGPTTFARLPRLDEVTRADVVVLGVPFDSGTTYRPGARFGPAHVRASSKLLRPFHPGLGVSPFAVQQVADAGDVALNPFDLVDAITTLERHAEALASDGLRLVTIGGDHTIALPLLRPLARRHGPIGVLHFDAHLDTWDTYFGAPYTHGTPFRRAGEEGLLDPARCLHVGIRGSLYAPTDLRDDAAVGFQVLTADDYQDRSVAGIGGVIEQVRARLGDGPVYISIDIDVLDPAHAPGTGTPEAGGLTSRELLHTLRGLVGLDLVGADIVEVSPPYDHAEMTGIAAAHLGYELLALMGRGRGAEVGGQLP